MEKTTMEMNKRRAFLARMLAAVGAMTFGRAAHSGNEPKYFVRYSCKPGFGASVAGYEHDRKNFEETEKIIRTNSEFMKRGLLLSLEEKRTETEIAFEYLFINRGAYKKWNRTIYRNGFFRRNRIPQLYRWQVTEHFI